MESVSKVTVRFSCLRELLFLVSLAPVTVEKAAGSLKTVASSGF